MTRAVVVVVALLTGCLDLGTSACGDGVCPTGTTCIRDDLRDAAACASIHGFGGGACNLCVLASCGNGVVDPGEACDDGNTISGDACPANCTQACGDGLVDPNEQCDDGNAVADDGCAPNCTNETCGNGYVDGDEACDDGNLHNADGCSSGCSIETASWSKLGVGPPDRVGHAMAYDAIRGKTVMFGGCAGNDPLECHQLLGDTWEWNGARWRELSPSASPSPRVGHTIVYDGALERVLLFGGCDQFLLLGGRAHCSHQLTDTWAWDGANWVELETSGSPDGGSYSVAAYDAARGVVMKFGGCVDLPPCVPSQQTYTFDGSTWTTRDVLTMPPSRMAHALAYDPRRDVIVMFGGFDEVNVFNDTWEWNGSKWSRRTPTSTPPPRRGHAMTFDPVLGKMLVIGGCASADPGPCTAPLDDEWVWDGTNWTELHHLERPSVRAAATAAVDLGRRELVMFGGGALATYGDTWIWDGVAWTARAVTTPDPRVAAMAYDAQRGVTVMFGGIGDWAILDDTWEWNGGAWIQRHPIVAPPARLGTSLAYDAARQRVILFGGFSSSQTYSDTWEWDGVAWIRRISAHHPTARGEHVMVYDPVRQEIVLVGGCQNMTWATCTTPLADVWTWDGADWTEHPSSGPMPRFGHALGYDESRTKVVMFGGSFGGGTLDDTWEWDGTTWTEIMPSARPGMRAGARMTYDATHGTLLMFGGAIQGVDLSNSPTGNDELWSWNGATWSRQASTPPNRMLAGFVFDRSRARAILFGGHDGYFSRGDTWEWDGASWIARGDTFRRPVERGNAAMTFDDRRARAIMFGGVRGSTGINIDDTWEWNGVRWNQLAPPTSPPPSQRGAMAYDHGRDQVVLFTGGDGTHETWTWDGMSWLRASSPSQPQGDAAMVYDSARETVVLFGGQTTATFNDTWEWDGVKWRERPSTTAPPSRHGMAMAYDAIHHVTVMFGGFGTADTWEWDGMDWHDRTVPNSPAPRSDHVMTYNASRGRVQLFGGGMGGQLDDSWEWDGHVWTQLVVSPTPGPRTGSAITFDTVRNEVIVFGGHRAGDFDQATWFFEFGTAGNSACFTGFSPAGAAVASTCALADCTTACSGCGDGTCSSIETCRSCPGDCGTCELCGDVHCDPTETCSSCPGDCGACP